MHEHSTELWCTDTRIVWHKEWWFVWHRELWTWIWSDKSGEDSLIQMHIYNFIQTILPSIQDKKLFKSDILWNPFTPKSD